MRTILPSSPKLFIVATFNYKFLIPLFAILICFGNDVSARVNTVNKEKHRNKTTNASNRDMPTRDIASPTITVNAVTGIITSCVGTPSSSPHIQQFTASGSGLSLDITITAPAGFEVSLTAASGYSSNITLVQSGGTVNSSLVYVRSSASASGSISGNVTLNSGAASQLVAVTGLVNALPTASGVPNQTVLNGGSTTAINFTGTANTFNWVNNTPGIGLPASGTGNIASFTAVNNGSSPITATITVNPQSLGLAYVAEIFSNNVAVVNTASHTVISQIQVGSLPYGVSVSPNGSRAYVTNGGDGSVSVINTTTNTVIATVTVGSRPQGIAVSPDGSKVYVANYISSTISVINGATNTVISTIPVGTNPTGIIASPDGTHVYTANSTDNTVSVVSTATNTATATISAGSDAREITITPDGTQVYVTNTIANTVTVINTATNTVVATIPVGASPLGISASPDGSKVFVASFGANNVSVISTATNAVISAIPVGSNPFGISTKPDGSEVYVANEGSTNISVISTATNVVSAPISLNGSPFSVGNFITGGSGCSGPPVTFTITINSTTPVITSSGVLTALNTSYGTASSSTNFTVSGVFMTAGILVTPPAGFEVSTDNSTFSNTVVAGAAGTITSVPIYVRLKASISAGNYSGNIVLSSAGATSVNVAIASSKVNKAALTITANNQNKIYGQALPVLTAIYSGFVNGDNSASLASLPVLTTTGTAASPAGTYPVTAAGAVGANYTISYTPGTLTIGTAPLTITAIDQNKIYGQPLPVFTASYNGFVNGDNSASLTTLPVLTTTGTVASVVGTYPITAGGAVDANYSITYVAGTMTIGKAALTITADDQNMAYGQPLPILTASYVGFVNGDTKASLTTLPVLITTATAASPIGTYPISINGAADVNYTITYVAGTLTIGQRLLQVTADNQSKNYGQANPALTFTYSGFINGDTQASLTSPAKATTIATTGSPAGSYDIIVSGASSPNYTINYTKGALTVNPVPLAVTANNQSKNYGQANPVLTFNYSGFVNGDTQASLTSTATANTTATTASSAGSYDINVSGASSPNYTISYTKAILTIDPVLLKITADNQTRAYGQANPSFTFSYSGFVNGDTQASLATLPTAATSATAASAVGMYAITPGGALSSNYTFNYLDGTLTITLATRTLTFNSLTSRTYGDIDFNAGATASSGEPIIYSSDNSAVATIVNGLVHITGAGQANITATVAANSNYTSIPLLSQALTVNKANQTIDLATIPALTPGGTYDLGTVTASSGLPVTFTVSDPTIATVSGQTLTALFAGTTTISASQSGNANYNAAPSITATVTVSNPPGQEIAIHPAVSPNGDGINDFLYIEGIKNFPENTVTVVNRNGVKVFQTQNYDNSTHLFDGHSNITGASQQAGTYFCLVEYTVNGERKRKTGYFVLKYE